MKKDYNNIENLMVRYFNLECSEDESRELLTWVNQSEQNKSDFIALKDIWDSSRKISDRTEDRLVQFYKTQYLKSRTTRLLFVRRAVAVAAVLVLALVINILVPLISDHTKDGYQVVNVPLGSRSKVTLADGTEVNLNSGSELKYSNSFSGQNRSVTLTGEAFFHVVTDAKHPFVVKTKNFDIEVSGTRFNVCTYSEDILTTATLAEGKINLQVHNTSKAFDIRPGEKFTFDGNAREYSLAEADIEQETAWKNGEFIFKKIKFPDLIKRLERWYDVKLTFSDERLASYTYSGRFKNQETIWQVLDALKLTSPIDYKRKSFREFEISCKPNN
jgi:ferric-dicitrate binding protein FerR (iron transport regulator)